MPRAPAARSPFSQETFSFLADLAAHNERDWFNAARERYENHFLAPALAFIEEIAPRIREISTHFRTIARPIGGSLMRIHRDTRFARDKSPYKTNVGIQFRHRRARDVHAPGFYVHIEPGRSFLGAGVWHPDSRSLAAIRAEIASQPRLWQDVLDSRAFERHFELGGDQLVRVPRGFPKDSPHADDLRRKDYVAACGLEDNTVVGAGFTALAAERLASAAPLVAFLCGALDLDF